MTAAEPRQLTDILPSTQRELLTDKIKFSIKNCNYGKTDKETDSPNNRYDCHIGTEISNDRCQQQCNADYIGQSEISPHGWFETQRFGGWRVYHVPS